MSITCLGPLRPFYDDIAHWALKGTIFVMATLKLVLTIIQVLGALFLTFVVLAQSGKSAGLSGAIAGGADTFLSKNKAKSWDAKLARWTKWVAIGFMVITLVLNLLPNAVAA